MRIIGLDASSVVIGWSIFDDQTLQAYGLITLGATGSDISDRCATAYTEIEQFIEAHTRFGATVVGIESPAVRFVKSAIPQCRVSGAVLASIANSGIMTKEIAPSEAKLALAKSGRASKEDMLRAAAPFVGYKTEDLTYRQVSKSKTAKWAAYDGTTLIYNEDAADAIGVGYATYHKVSAERAESTTDDNHKSGRPAKRRRQASSRP